MSKEDGGSAFPFTWINQSDVNAIGPNGNSVPPGMADVYPGMSLRDYFAAHCPSDICNTDDRQTASEIAGYSYESCETALEKAYWNAKVEAMMRYVYADAMLKERK